MSETSISAKPALLPGGGATGSAIRAMDWSRSPLGALDTWPGSLRATLSLMLNTPESMYLVWGDDLVFLFNDAYRPILGERLATALGRPFPQVWADAWGQVRPYFDAARAGEATRVVDLPVTMMRNGAEAQTWWSFSYSPVYDESGAVAGVFCITNETTERVRTADAVRVVNASLAGQVAERTAERDRIWQVSRDMLGVADDTGIWASVNPAWERILGWAPEEIVGHRTDWLLHPDDATAAEDEIRQLARGTVTLAFENRLRAKDGTYRRFNWTAVPVEGRLYCVARDITEERARETALRDSQDFAGSLCRPSAAWVCGPSRRRRTASSATLPLSSSTGWRASIRRPGSCARISWPMSTGR